jgi:hypothetical protein
MCTAGRDGCRRWVQRRLEDTWHHTLTLAPGWGDWLPPLHAMQLEVLHA